MKVLIAYASKTGTTRECALELAKKIPQVTVIDLNEGSISPGEFQVIILGSSVRMGRIQKVVKQYILDYMDVLKDKYIGGYICNGFIDQEKTIIEQNFPKEFIEKAFYLKSFGGTLHMDKITGFDMFITKLVTNGSGASVNVELLEDRIQELANAILGL